MAMRARRMTSTIPVGTASTTRGGRLRVASLLMGRVVDGDVSRLDLAATVRSKRADSQCGESSREEDLNVVLRQVTASNG